MVSGLNSQKEEIFAMIQKAKNKVIEFALSRVGVWIAPAIGLGVARVCEFLAKYGANVQATDQITIADVTTDVISSLVLTAVLSWQSKSNKDVQAIVGVKQDGNIGPVTKGAITDAVTENKVLKEVSFNDEKVINALKDQVEFLAATQESVTEAPKSVEPAKRGRKKSRIVTAKRAL